MVIVRLVPLPSKKKLAAGTSAMLPEVADRASRKTGVSGSVTVKGIVMGASSFVV